MGKENKVLQEIRSDLQKAGEFWPPILLQAWHDAWTLWLWIFVVPLAVDLVAGILHITKFGVRSLMTSLGDFFGIYVLSFAIVLLVIYLYFVITSSASKFLDQEKKADLFDPKKGVEIIAFNPDEFDTQPAGALVTNRKGKTIKCHALLKNLHRNRRTMVVGGEAFAWKKERNYSYIILENDKPELLMFERIIGSFPKHLEQTAHKALSRTEEEIKDYKTFAILETDKKDHIELYENEKYALDVDFWFIINNVYLKHWIVQFDLEVKNAKLRVTKIREWLDEDESEMEIPQIT